MSALHIRPGVPGDEDLVFTLLRELAVYEKLTDKFFLTREIIFRDFLSTEKSCCCDIAFAGAEPVGLMNWYRTYSSFAAARGLFLEDLYVRPAFRGRGRGKALLAHLAAQALRENRTYIDWSVLDWNETAIAFYEGLSAERAKGWFSYRLRDDALKRLARS